METQTHENMKPLTEPARITLTELDTDRLRRAILATAPAAAPAAAGRPILSAVLIEFGADQWTLTATDSYMLITCELDRITADHPNNTRPTGSVKVPAEWIHKAAKTWKKNTRAQIEVNAAEITLHTITPDRTTTATPLTLTEFPNWRNLWPTPDQMTEQRHASLEVGTPQWIAPRYNPMILAQVCDSARTLTGQKKRPEAPESLDITHTDPHKPGILTCTVEGIRMQALVMPIRPR